jgi:hypothetical protein
MNIEWHENLEWHDESNPEFRAFVARDGRDTLFSVCQRGSSSEDYTKCPLTRWCVFKGNRYDGYMPECDIPITLSDDEVKAMAITLWRLHGGTS